MQLNDETVSVIIPVYNAEKYLTRCLDSVICQTYEDLEIILVDDGSTDGSPAICDKYAKNDDRVKVIHKENEGPGAARNAGLEVAGGGYIGFIDSDDYIESDMYRSLMECLKQSEADLCICNYDLFDEGDGRILDTFEYGFDECMTKEDAFDRIGKFIAVWDCLYKVGLFEGVRFEKDKFAEDFIIWPYIINKCRRIAYLSAVKYHFNIKYSRHIGEVEKNIRKFDRLEAEISRAEFFCAVGDFPRAARTLNSSVAWFCDVKSSTEKNAENKAKAKGLKARIKCVYKNIPKKQISFKRKAVFRLFFLNTGILCAARKSQLKRRSNDEAGSIAIR